MPKIVQAVRVRIPQPATLKKYGLAPREWLEIAKRQGMVCAVCKRLPPNGRLCTDHEHVPKWKRMPPEQRKLYVRGLLCFWCNKSYMGQAITLAKAQAMVEFLTAYEERRPCRR